MSTDRYPRLYEKIGEALREKPKRDALYGAMKRGRDNRRTAIENYPTKDQFRKEVRASKLRCIDQMEELTERFAQKARERGAKVVIAKDGKEAIAYVLKVCREKRAKTCIKSKSLTSEEIHVNDPMIEDGIGVIETDLGELIIQKVNEKPYHLVFPAVHKTAVEVAEIFTRELGEEIPPDVNVIMKHVRKYLRPIFLNADIGMTGANIAIAENGVIVIEENEGNARLVSSVPDCHICIMGMEKIVETIDDALQMCLAHPISATGQLLTTYVNFMGGRGMLGENGTSPRESHIIILDNGRTAMREDPALNDALNCIRCGACMNICPTYGVVGGHTFGYVYPGPIGIPWTAAVHGLENAGDFAPLCISCGLCKEICPAEIDIPMMIAEVKHRDMEKHKQPLVNQVMMLADHFAKFGSMTAPVSNWFIKNKLFRIFLEKTHGIDRRRGLPAFSRLTFDKWFASRPKPAASTPPKRKTAFFVDIFANYNDPRIGMAVVQVLEALGCEVANPPQKSSGYPFIGYGDLGRAKKLAEYNVKQLLPYADRGFDIVATEPTASYCLKVSYPKLLKTDESKRVAERNFEIFEYIMKIADEDPDTDLRAIFPSLEGKRFGFHISCHQRPISASEQTMELFRRCGAQVEVIETGTCCGMGGTFGIKKGMLGYDLSNAVGEPLFQLFKESGVDAIVTESSVCNMQLAEGAGMPVYHPLRLLCASLWNGKE